MPNAKKMTVFRRDPKSLELAVLAEFTLDDKDQVEAKYYNPRFMVDVLDGIWIGSRKYTPENGAAFLHALEETYSGSSLISVEID
jgi:hypothetical protein